MATITPKAVLKLQFLASLPEDGSFRVLASNELETAHLLHIDSLVFMASDTWPHMMASITYEGRNELRRLRAGVDGLEHP